MKTVPVVALLAALVAFACSKPGSSSLPPQPGPGYRKMGVQIWNGTREAVSCRITAESETGEVVVLLESLRIPAGESEVDPSLGDDPKRACTLETWLAPGRWTAVVTAGERTVRHEVQWPDAPWSIVRVATERIEVESRADAIRLE